jgi:hypothetical protein
LSEIGKNYAGSDADGASAKSEPLSLASRVVLYRGEINRDGQDEQDRKEIMNAE